MRVNLVSETSWILGRCARELHERLGWSINSTKPHDIDYHLPYWREFDPESPKTAPTRVGFFTHGFRRAEGLRNDFDAAVCMNERMEYRLRGMPVQIIKPGVNVPSKAPTFGVVGRTYRDGRKGEEMVARAVAAGYDFLSLGPGPWPCESAGADPERNASLGFWHKIDYLVVTANDEGGPMPALEAIAHRVPVIAPDVGFCWEIPVIRYEAGNWKSLEVVLHRLTVLPTWEDWARRHQMFFELILETKETKEAVA